MLLMKYEFYEVPPTYFLLMKKLASLTCQYPFLKVFSAGNSALGRKIPVIGIGNLRCPNLFASAFHAQEWLTCTVLIRFLEDLCDALCHSNGKLDDIDFGRTFRNKGILFMPMVNPDGVEIALNGIKSAGKCSKKVEAMMATSPRSWQANARGVDLNHNYDANFTLSRIMEIENGITQPGPRQYGGPCPHSEPETKAVVRICYKYPIRCAYAFHSQGEEIYYQYGKYTPEASEYMASLFASFSGYTVTKPSELASHAGFKDWFIENFHRPGFTFEIGKGTNPLPITDFPEVYKKLKSTMVLASIL